jgi:hypothetical protein
VSLSARRGSAANVYMALIWPVIFRRFSKNILKNKTKMINGSVWLPIIKGCRPDRKLLLTESYKAAAF